jgi:hypothetical protein
MPTVVELVAALKARGLSEKGLKGALVARLAEAEAVDEKTAPAFEPPPLIMSHDAAVAQPKQTETGIGSVGVQEI